MLFKFPKDDAQFAWTSHVKQKMVQYRLSEQKIKTILKNSNRREEGIAPKTSAVMKRNDTPKRKEEMWVMFLVLPSRTRGITQKNTRTNAESQISNVGGQKLRIISAWRYPGVSPTGKAIPIPEDIWKELENL